MSRFEVHHTVEAHPDTSLPDPHQDMFIRNKLGFWAYLMTDCVLFASLFITHAVLEKETFGGPSGKDLFSLGLAFAETIVLLCSSICCGLGVLASLKGDKKRLLKWLAVSLLFGASFLAMELHEFISFVEAGHSWRQSAFLSSYFTLVGTHGLHVTIGSFWMLVLMAQIHWYGITVFTFRRLILFGMFWHFLDLVWIFIFTFVYLLGVM